MIGVLGDIQVSAKGNLALVSTLCIRCKINSIFPDFVKPQFVNIMLSSFLGLCYQCCSKRPRKAPLDRPSMLFIAFMQYSPAKRHNLHKYLR